MDVEVTRAYKYKIDPTKEQQNLFIRTFGCCRFFWNQSVANRQETESTEALYPASLKPAHPWLREIDSSALACEQLFFNKAVKSFLEGNTEDVRFHAKKYDRHSYTTANTNNNIRLEGGYLVLPKAGKVKIHMHRNLPRGCRIKQACIKEEGYGHWFVVLFVAFDLWINDLPATNPRAIGLDYSSPHMFVSTDFSPAPPRLFRKLEDKIAREDRKLSRMQEGSNNYYKQKDRVAKLKRKLGRVRLDYSHKLSNWIANNYDIVGVEDLDLHAQAQALSFGKAVGDNGFGRFRSHLEYKLEAKNKHLVYVDGWYPSTKTCHVCGVKNPDVTLGMKTWECPHCGTTHDRDINASINIRQEALRIIEEEPQLLALKSKKKRDAERQRIKTAKRAA